MAFWRRRGVTDDGVRQGILEAVEAGFDGQIAFPGEIARLGKNLLDWAGPR